MRFNVPIGTYNLSIRRDMDNVSFVFSIRYRNDGASPPQVEIGLPLAVV
jgi:hypothetical protein